MWSRFITVLFQTKDCKKEKLKAQTIIRTVKPKFLKKLLLNDGNIQWLKLLNIKVWIK